MPVQQRGAQGLVPRVHQPRHHARLFHDHPVIISTTGGIVRVKRPPLDHTGQAGEPDEFLGLIGLAYPRVDQGAQNLQQHAPEQVEILVGGTTQTDLGPVAERGHADHQDQDRLAPASPAHQHDKPCVTLQDAELVSSWTWYFEPNSKPCHHWPPQSPPAPARCSHPQSDRCTSG